VCGTNSHSVFVYDLDSRKSIVRISAHDDEVNAVCYGDQSSPHILYSGSDDSTIKVWDRRSLGDGRAAGCFLGHTEGVTYIDSKGDGRYVLSNGKDQRMKLWDLRKMSPPEVCSMQRQNKYMADNFDYRGDGFEQHPYKGPHPDDSSVVTYRGHRVAKTLIRCHFSPQGSTDSRYVYTGSADGKVHIFNIDGTLAKKIDVAKASYGCRPKTSGGHRMYWGMDSGTSWSTCVRDVSWHPNAPVLAATAWNGWGGDCGTCTTHTWNDGLEEDEGPPMGARVNAKLQRDPRYYGEAAVRTTAPGMATRAQRRRYLEEDDDEGSE
jgi:WD repeat-containing protein 23